ncbi:MAG: (2Fe-2S)-binding protein [Pseudomonadota bacterium]
MATTLQINGETRTLEAADDTPLLWALRDEVGLTGTKYGCGVALCGACTVQVDGVALRSCQMALGDLEGASVVTIEGLASPEGRALQQAWRELDVVQCGYCQSGQIMQAADLLAQTPKPSDDDIDAAMWGNVCRCATYQRIRAGIHRAAELLEA